MHYFFCGIGGSGMSALARIFLTRGATVSGSDRSYDQGKTPEKFAQLQDEGMTLYPQDGGAIAEEKPDILVVSSAVEDTIRDVKAAKAAGIPIQKRAELLAGLFNEAQGIAIGGTSGKTTTTAMIGHLLSALDRDPTIMNGGLMMNFIDETSGAPRNAIVGKGDDFVSEVDESDGSIALFVPDVAVLTNITLDHKPLEELRPLFENYLKAARRGVVINLDDPESVRLKDVHPQARSFSLLDPSADFYAADLRPQPAGMRFTLHTGGESYPVTLAVPGVHNVANMLAALAALSFYDGDMDRAVAAAGRFKGVHRRLEIVGTKNNITIIDDFGHNPDKIRAALETLRAFDGRLLVMFQPHGFGPTKMMKDELIATFAAGLAADDILIMPEIYYAGGTTTRSISSRDVLDGVAAHGRQPRFFETRPEILPFITQEARPGDRVVIMGARDDTLSDFAQAILSAISS